MIGMNIVYAACAYPFGKLADRLSHPSLLGWGLLLLIAADAFLAACTQETEMRECPIYDCKAAPMDAVCVGGHCMLRPRP